MSLMREHYGLFSRRGSYACNKPGTDMNKIQFLLLSLILTLPVTAMAQSSIKGDVNGDGTVNITDLNAVINMIIDDSATMIADVNGDGAVNIADINAIISIIIDGPAEEEEEDEYVDLGLPSGTLWATRNIGANSPEEYGDYFAWGETTPKDVYTVQTYKWGGYDSDGHFYLSKYNSISGYGTIDNKNELDPEDDAAYVNWGAAWRMPSQEQIQELINNCTWKWTQSNGVNGMLFTGPNGNTLFLPAAGIYDSGDNSFLNEGSIGEYWSRMLNPSDDINARALGLSETDISYGGDLRTNGFTVRAVRASHN